MLKGWKELGHQISDFFGGIPELFAKKPLPTIQLCNQEIPHGGIVIVICQDHKDVVESFQRYVNKVERGPLNKGYKVYYSSRRVDHVDSNTMVKFCLCNRNALEGLHKDTFIFTTGLRPEWMIYRFKNFYEWTY